MVTLKIIYLPRERRLIKYKTCGINVVGKKKIGYLDIYSSDNSHFDPCREAMLVDQQTSRVIKP